MSNELLVHDFIAAKKDRGRGWPQGLGPSNHEFTTCKAVNLGVSLC